ncbi:hypothetical protein RB531_4701 [Salmonella enterica subsp. enterica serovar Typhimurium]|nr:peptidase S1 and S6 chymotrypsin/Hap [Salmonella enterica subsp. enterica serovar Heidelberg str. N4496]
MHKTIAVLLGIVCFLPVMAKAGGLKQTPRMPATLKRFF